MEKTNKRMLVALVIVAGAIAVAVGIATTQPEKKKAASWGEEAEGFLAVAAPCCSSANVSTPSGKPGPGKRLRSA